MPARFCARVGRHVLLSVPKYDFNWQLTYRTEQPLHLPKGSKIHCTAHYDNSAANKATVPISSGYSMNACSSGVGGLGRVGQYLGREFARVDAN